MTMDNHPDKSDLPFISIFMAVRNEGKTIERCLTSFFNQSYPRDKFELIIADKSEDETVAILDKYAAMFPDQMKVLQNPSGRTVDGLNLSLLQCRGSIVVLYIGHAYPEKDFLRNIAASLRTENIDMVGGRVIPESRTGAMTSQAIALALMQPYAVGSNSFTLTERRQVKSMHWMAVKKDLVDTIGTFNTKYSPRGEDCDWYERLIAAGGRAVFEPSIVSHYFMRETFSRQFVIQVKNAYYRMQPFFDSGRCVRLRHLLPLIILLLTAIISVMTASIIPAAIVILFYLAASMTICLFIIKGKLRYWPFVTWAIVLIHGGHCIGMIAGIIRFAPTSLAARIVALCGGSPRFIIRKAKL